MSSTQPAPAPFAVVILSLLLQGCMSAQSFDGADDTSSAADSGWDPTDSDDDTDDGDQTDPSWWSLNATILMEDGLSVQSDTTVVISLIDDTADPASPICQASYEQVEFAVLDSPDASIYHWWQAALSEPVTDCSAHRLTWIPADIELGIGALHPDIAALLEPAGHADIEPYLYGAYVRSGQEDTIWTYGISATAAGWDSEQLPVSEGPVPNGTYSLVPIYLLPLQGG